MCAIALAMACSCGHKEVPVGSPLTLAPPLGLPAVPVPKENPPTRETIALGRRLFHDTRLSSNDTLSCATCHDPGHGFADRRKTSTGAAGKSGIRNAPSILNAAYGELQFWDGRAPSLEDQAGGPMANSIEMNQPHDVSVAKLSSDASYKSDFERAFGPGSITIYKVQNALAAFERTLLSGNSAFDRYEYGGDKRALTEAAIRGLGIFRSAKGNCSACHLIGASNAVFQDGGFHNIGVGINFEGALVDAGRYEITKVEADRGAFKTPTLRNVAQTAPYMHDGSLRTLRQVVDFYAGGGNSNPNLDRRIAPLSLTGQERDDLVSFLESLSGEVPKPLD